MYYYDKDKRGNMSDPIVSKNAIATHRKPMISAVSGRRTLTRPVGGQTMLNKKEEIVVKRTAAQQIDMAKQVKVRMQQQRMAEAQAQAEQPRQTAAEIKNEAIQKAIASVAKAETKKNSKIPHIHFGWKRTLLALTCTAIAIFAIVYFVNLNAPNVSLKVAAMQSGIEATYPAYVPRGYNLSDITSEKGKIVLNFSDTATGDSFSLTEENSVWDSNALLNNYVREEYGEDYTVIKEQGLTIYVSNSDATWVNRGIIYKLQTKQGSLTKKQIKTIAVSL